MNLIKSLLLTTTIALLSCQDNSLPKPYGELLLQYPQASYKKWESNCPFTFDYNAQSLQEKKDGYCNFNLYSPQLKATIYLTYEDINHNLPDLIKDAEKSVYEPHTTRAEYIDPQIIVRPQDHVYGTLYTLGGNAALNFQFHLTDSTAHFLRGAVYFNAHPNPDSLAPAINHIKKDVTRLMESLHWK